jgi:hypothetical protein
VQDARDRPRRERIPPARKPTYSAGGAEAAAAAPEAAKDSGPRRTEHVKSIAHLPLRMDGLGLRSAVGDAPAGY